MEQFTPFLYDNILFDAAYIGHAGGKHIWSWDAFLGYIDEIRTYDNWRLANIAAPLTTLFMPKWIFSVMTGFCVAASVWLAARLGAGNRPGLVEVASVWVALTLFLPWRNNLLTGDYALNYLFAGFIALSFIYFALRLADCRFKRLECFAAFALGVILALWHEGFALPVAAGMFLYAVVRRGRVSGLFLACALLVGVLSMTWALESHLAVRGAREIGAGAVSAAMPGWAVSNILALMLAACICAVFTLPTLRQRWLPRMNNPAFILTAGASFAGAVLSGAVKFSPRTAFWPEMCAVVAFMTLLSPWMRERRRILDVAAAAVVALLALHAAYVISWIKKLDKQNAEIMAQIESDPRGYAYADLIRSEDVPVGALGFPCRGAFTDVFTYRCLNERYRPKRPTVLPLEFRRFGEARIDTIDVRTGIYLLDGKSLFTSCVRDAEGGSDRCGTVRLSVKAAEWESARTFKAFQIDFTAPDGKRYSYLYPFRMPSCHIQHVRFENARM